MNLIKGSDTVARMQKEFDFTQNKPPAVAIIRVGDKEDDIAYERNAIKVLKKYHITPHAFTFAESITHEAFVKEFKAINSSSTINGILLLRPLPEHIDTNEIEFLIDPQKDIDGISPINIGRIFNECEQALVPCTPQATMEIIKTLGIDLSGMHVVIVGSGKVVGKPLSLLMISAGATVTLCNIFTKDLAFYTKRADVLVVATGVRNLITADHVAPSQIVIDVGINCDEQGQLCGDVKFDEVAKIVKAITPVPGGVGPVTTCVLAQNAYKASKLQLL